MAHVVTAVQHQVRWRMLLLQFSTKSDGACCYCSSAPSEMAHVFTAVQHQVKSRMLLLQYSTKSDGACCYCSTAPSEMAHVVTAAQHQVTYTFLWPQAMYYNVIMRRVRATTVAVESNKYYIL